MNELERIQEEQVGLGSHPWLGAVCSMHACQQQLGFADELRASRRSRRCLAAARHHLLSVLLSWALLCSAGAGQPCRLLPLMACTQHKGERRVLEVQLAISQASVTAHSLLQTPTTLPRPTGCP